MDAVCFSPGWYTVRTVLRGFVWDNPARQQWPLFSSRVEDGDSISALNVTYLDVSAPTRADVHGHMCDIRRGGGVTGQ